MSRCDVCLEEVDDGVSCAACVDVEGRIASATAALRARAERYREALDKASDALDDLAAEMLASRPDIVLRLTPVRKALAATGDEDGKGGDRG